MAVDGLACAGAQGDAECRRASLDGVVVRGGKVGEVLNARRERSSRPVQGTLLWSNAEARPGAAPGVIVRRDGRPVRCRAVWSVPARVSPEPLADGASRGAHAGGGVRTVGCAATKVKAVIHETRSLRRNRG